MRCFNHRIFIAPAPVMIMTGAGAMKILWLKQRIVLLSEILTKDLYHLLIAILDIFANVIQQFHYFLRNIFGFL